MPRRSRGLPDFSIVALLKEEAGHKFRGNQYTTGETDGPKPSAAPAPPARQSDPGRFQTPTDRFTSVPTPPAAAPAGEKKPDAPKDDAPKPKKSEIAAEVWGTQENLTRVKSSMKSGRTVKVPKEGFVEILKAISREGGSPKDVINIVKLKLEGTRLIGHGNKGISRVDMPQIPPPRRKEFCEWFKKTTGRGFKETSLDPMKLLPTQKEINGRNTARLFREYSKNGAVPDEERIIVSKDGHVLDGHHTWAAAIALAITNPGAKVPVYQIDATTEQCVADGRVWDEKEGIGGLDVSAVKKWLTNALLRLPWDA